MKREELIDEMWKADDQTFLRFLMGNNEKYNLAKYFFHTHTDYGSPKDAILTAKQYVTVAKEMGAKAISITDHGTMYGVIPLYNECVEAGLKLILGVEFYVCDTIEDKKRSKHTRLHLCGYAVNPQGYKALANMVTLSNNRVISFKSKDVNGNTTSIMYPCISKKILESVIGPGTPGHGNVILTSACISGVLTGLAKANEENKKNLELVKNHVDSGKKAMDMLLFTEKALDQIEKDKEVYTALAKKNYKKRRQALAKNPNPEEEAILEKEEEESKEATQKLKELQGLRKEAKSKNTAAQKELDSLTKVKFCDVESFKRYLVSEEKEVRALESEIIPTEKLASQFEKEALWYDNLAGHGNWYIEIQNHHMDEEKLFMPALVEIAHKHHIPLIAANDAHMAKKEDCIARKFVNSLRFNKWEEPSIADKEVYLKDDVSLFKILAEIVGNQAAWEAMKNREIIANRCNCQLTKEPRYPKFTEA